VNPTIRRAAVLAVALAALGCRKEETPIQRAQAQAAEPSAGDPVRLTVTTAKPEVALGDDIVLHFKLTNGGKSDVQVNVPRLDKRSVSLRVRTADGDVASVTRIHAEMSQTGQIIADAPEVKVLASGASLEQDVTTVAVQAGTVTITPSYTRQGAPAALVAEPVEVKVTPRDAKAPRLGVKLDTTHGSFTAAFRPDVAYNTVESFATLVKAGFYTGLKFHRIMAGFMAQGGDPKGTGEGGPGYFLPLEANLKLRHTRGVMSMARSRPPDTAGSQFFIMFAANQQLDQGRYTTFAEMTDGEETLKKLEAVPCGPSSSDPTEISSPKEVVQIKFAQLVTLP
jgi:peptidyl-prolyl cis-trans isomerase B (cyclophilin B)